MHYMLCQVITCMITCYYMLPFCITCSITWYWATITCHYMLPFCITCSITWYLDSYYTIFCLQLHVLAIYYMPHHVTSLVAAAAEAPRAIATRAISARAICARAISSLFSVGFILPENNPAHGDHCEVLAAILWLPAWGPVTAEIEECWWCLGMSWMWLQNIQVILPSSKIESARSKFNTELIGKWMIHIK